MLCAVTVTVSVLFNEPKLLKCADVQRDALSRDGFSALQRAEIAEICSRAVLVCAEESVSVLFNEPKLLKLDFATQRRALVAFVSVLFNEPKLLKSRRRALQQRKWVCFSALQRAEIAEMVE